MAAAVSPLRSIGARLFAYVLSGALVGLGGMSYLFYRVLEGRARDEIQSRLRVQTTRVEGQLTRVEEAIVSFSSAIKALHRLDHRDADAYKALDFEFFQKRPPLVMGVGFGQTPFKIVSDRQWFYPYFYVDQGVPGTLGDPLPAPFQDIRYGEMFTADNYPEQDYYKLPVAARRSLWLEPYDWYGITMTSFYAPCFDDHGELIGVANADVNVTGLSEPINTPVVRGLGYFAILSEKGNLLAYPPDPEKAKVRSSRTAIPDLDAVWPRMQVDEEGIFVADGQLWAYERIEGPRWLLFAALPTEAVTGPVLRIAVGSGLSAGVLLAIVVALFVRRLNKGLSPILEQCESTTAALSAKEAKEKGPRRDKGAQGEDEIEILARSFDQMSRQIKASFAELEEANLVLEARVEERTAFLKQQSEELVASQKKLAAAWEAALAGSRAKSEFLASMSHELRTPLNGILGYAQLLQRSPSLTPAERHGVEVIHQSGTYLLLLINDILDLAKIEARKMELYPTDISLLPFLAGVVEVCRVQAEQKGITLEYRPGPDLPEGVRVDEKRLRQILLNVLGNAVKFTDQGTVTFTARLLERWTKEGGEERAKLRFQIDDTGSGMTAEQVERLFTPFEQASDRSRERGGTGLGLSISQKIAHVMGSAIQVDSSAGAGSTFWLDLDLPCSARESLSPSIRPAASVVGFEGPPRRILVVDDNAVNRSLLIDTLEPLGFAVNDAADGASGLALAREIKPDLVITDLAMPGMSGLDLVRALRDDAALSGLKIIVSSASVFAADQHQSLDAGADAFLPKPVALRDLLELLGQHLALTWISKKADRPSLPQRESYSDLEPPPREEMARLLDLARRGRVNGLLEAARRLEQSDPKLAPFVKRVSRLARAFQVDELCAMLARYEER